MDDWVLHYHNEIIIECKEIDTLIYNCFTRLI